MFPFLLFLAKFKISILRKSVNGCCSVGFFVTVLLCFCSFFRLKIFLASVVGFLLFSSFR